ncbi:MAG: polysaccharide pyruvyl transferase CsaB [Defluviitaleaceae bacterium]|nr:polysaccharide pyruvyl transferase CsaB [Defluviitaleaceae bacterium]
MNSFENTKVLMALMGMEIGGAETHVLELCKALKTKGMDVYVVSNGGVYEKELIEHGIKHFKAPLHNKSPKNLVASYLGLKRIIIDNNIKLVHAHARIPAFLCGMLQKKLGFTFVTTAHAMFNNAVAYRLLTNFGDASLAIAEDIKENLLSNYKMDRGRVFLTINGINTDTFGEVQPFDHVMREFNLEPHHQKIVNISRMDKDMSQAAHKLIEIAPAIYEKNPNARIIIVGGGNDLDGVAARAKAANDALGEAVVIVTGTRTDVPQFLSLGNIFVGVSRSALEAMACGLPVVLAGGQGYLGTFTPEIRDEAIKTNFTCRGHEEVMGEDLKADIFSLMDASPNKIKEIATHAKEMVQQEYSVDRMAEDTLRLYRSVRKSERPIDALISGYYGSNNHGDDALLRAIVEDLRNIKPNIRISVISKRPKETKEIYKVDTLYRFNFWKIVKTIKQSNLLIMGGGSLMQDLTSTRSLIYYIFVMNRAAKHGAKTMLYANGIGPLTQENNKRRAVNALRKAEKITLRDKASKETLASLGFESDNVQVTADAAFRFREGDQEGATRLLDDVQIYNKQFFCVSVRAWKDLKSDFITEMAVFCDYMVEKYGLHPLFIPMQPSNDAEISTKILEKQKNRGFYLEKDFTIEEIIAIASRAEFVLGMRLHSIIYGANANTPVIGLVYDPKVSAMLDALGQSYYIDLKDIDSMRLITMAEEIMDKRDEIKSKLAATTQVLFEKSKKNPTSAHDIIDRDLF